MYNNSAIHLRNIFQDSLSCMKQNEKLKRATEKMTQATIVYTQNIDRIPSVGMYPDTEIEVVENTMFSCARKNTGDGKVAVLNFANAYRPGGGVVNGALAQEECLCRSSNLYAGLTTPVMMEQYYSRNRTFSDAVGSDAVAYHPGVTVFKDDEVFANPLKEKDWFQVDVITCAAPHLTKDTQITDEQLYLIHVKRGRRIIQAAIANHAEILILGAFGCGAFHNNPTTVAMAYRYLLKDEGYASFFSKVIFAIKKDYNDVKGNYDCFKKVMRN